MTEHITAGAALIGGGALLAVCAWFSALAVRALDEIEQDKRRGK